MELEKQKWKEIKKQKWNRVKNTGMKWDQKYKSEAELKKQKWNKKSKEDSSRILITEIREDFSGGGNCHFFLFSANWS